MKFREKICVDLFFVFHKFQGDSRFLDKIPGYFQGSKSLNKFQAFQGFQGALGTLYHVYKHNTLLIHYLYLHSYHIKQYRLAIS